MKCYTNKCKQNWGIGFWFQSEKFETQLILEEARASLTQVLFVFQQFCTVYGKQI